MLRLICGYALQWKTFQRKTVFFYGLKGEWYMYSVDNLVMG